MLVCWSVFSEPFLVPPSALWTGSKKPPLALVPRPFSPSKLRENGRACEVGGGNHKDPRGLCGFLERVQGEWNDSASPSVSFLDISPAKAGREFRARSGSSLGLFPPALQVRTSSYVIRTSSYVIRTTSCYRRFRLCLGGRATVGGTSDGGAFAVLGSPLGALPLAVVL
jgi:hypothetical protein